ncbi:type I methionyl aminopeptidase [Enterobacteriaceae bacterium ET-AT1-13]|nr:type I methionyl aminopeptidase [Enterobacteriaceae bacterium ET-AT1-13]WGS66515.1 type I methionyl aminopeptidase [Enterobacteriaceae bacterium Cmel17]WMC17539.1 MAG: type I methionyl aminopeptidase [Enterobacteriaceae bacterium Cmel21]WMC17746.1 MAG: type I methionyl aminopeptidase [Enterobacteriaceae bacterium PSmelAO3-2]WMC17950.1 MAG: type I methionyl aminopeptidase [Enterobacteriaceae bacterium PSmelAO3-1]WMC18152.1 MAG: type I methionyl aminopeptidase [Enterobacteriaceae bacterium PS
MIIKNFDEIKKIRTSCYLASQVLEMIKKYIIPGITTKKLDKICNLYIINNQKAIPACLGYKGFPKSVCISVNDTVCHGIPKNKKLKNGDIVNIDVTILKNGFFGDTSKMFLVGKVKNSNKLLCNITQQSLYLSIYKIKPGIKLNTIGNNIEKFIKFKNNYSIVKKYCGHGIGKKFHELPNILHFKNNNNIILKKGMIFTIEPIINLGKNKVFILKDGWTVKTKDKSLSAQYEHTILVTSNGCEIMTIRKNENIPKIIINK